MKKVTFNVPVTRNKADAKAYKLNDFDENTYTIHPHPYHTNSPPSSRDNQNMANTSFTEKSRAAQKNAKYISILLSFNGKLKSAYFSFFAGVKYEGAVLGGFHRASRVWGLFRAV